MTELGVEPGNDIPIELRHGSEETALSYSASEALTKLTTLRGEAVGDDLMSISMMHGATGLGDLIDMGGHRQGDQPILEFARHFRNACAHGDRWHFRNKEPKHPAACQRSSVVSDTAGPASYMEHHFSTAVRSNSLTTSPTTSFQARSHPTRT